MGLVLAALGAAACGGGSRVEIDPSREMIGTRWNGTLATSSQLAGAVQVKGMGWMAADDRDTARTRAFAAIENAVPGGEHPWHVHLGRCGTDRGILGPPQAYSPLRVGGDGRAEADAVLPVPVPTSGEYSINVHASVNNMGTILACGNLAPPSR